MFQKGGAQKVTAIEANIRAFLKCLCVKEIFNLDRVEFKLGDFMIFLKDDCPSFDLVFASGVLYHMENPLHLLELISQVTNKVFIWTHYYDEKKIAANNNLADKFSTMKSLFHKGVEYDYSIQSYKKALNWTGFCGGPEPQSKWLTKESIIRALNNFGFAEIQFNFEDPDHQNGPSFALCARK